MKTKSHLIVVFLLAIVTFTGCKDDSPEPTFTLSGQVTDSYTNEPLQGVNVKLTLENSSVSQSVSSDGSGNYQFPDLLTGNYRLSFMKENYSEGVEAMIEIGESKANKFDKRLDFTKKLEFKGKVKDKATGNPVSSVSVKVKSSNNQTSTNSSGDYTISNLDRGKYTLVFVGSEYEQIEKEITVSTVEATNKLDVELNRNITTLKGKVLDASTRAVISGATLKLVPAATPATATSNASGEYSFTGLNVNNYTLTCTRNGYIDFSAQVTVNISQSENTFEVNLTPQPIVSTAKVSVSESFTIDNGAYLWLSHSSNLKNYYYACWSINNLPSSDDAIKNYLLTKSPSTAADVEMFYYDLEANRKYVFCSIAVDNANNKGQLVKYEFTTKSQSGQPLANITVNSIYNNVLNFNVVRNSYCNGYKLVALQNVGLNELEDIELATYLYKSQTTSLIYQNIYSYPDTYPANVTNVIFSLAYNSSGVPGLLSRVYFSTKTNNVLTKSSSTLKSSDSEVKSKPGGNFQNIQTTILRSY